MGSANDCEDKFEELRAMLVARNNHLRTTSSTVLLVSCNNILKGLLRCLDHNHWAMRYSLLNRKNQSQRDPFLALSDSFTKSRTSGVHP